MNEKCKICKFICDKESVFKISSTCTLHTKVLLQDFIEIVIEDEFNFADSSICSICYDLLNELDKFRENYRIGCKRIKQYLQSNKHDAVTPQSSVKENIKLENEEIVIDSIGPTARDCGNVRNISLKAFKSTSEIEEHVKTHVPSKQYVCEICGVSYRTQKSLKVHVGMHNGINPFTCKYCNKSFTQKINLIRHLPLHTGEAPYQCDLCGKRYIHDSSFRLHKKSHKGQKDIKCEKCSLAFFSKSHLTRHQRVHTGEKKYTCKTCGKSFAEKYNLVAHEKLHENSRTNRQHKCEVCDMTFYKKTSLEEHLVQVHQKVNKNGGPFDFN